MSYVTLMSSYLYYPLMRFYNLYFHSLTPFLLFRLRVGTRSRTQGPIGHSYLN